MSRATTILLSSLLLLHPLTVIEGRECRAKNDKTVTLKDLRGTYVGTGTTSGGSQPTSSANVFTVKIREDGTGVLLNNSVRSFVSGQATFAKQVFPPNTLPPAKGAITVSVNKDGTGEMLIYGYPTVNDIGHLELGMQKQDGKVVKFYGLLSGVDGPGANTPTAQEIKIYTFERQFD